jgi:hypothetical protein
MDMLTTMGTLRSYINESLQSQRPIETRLEQLVLDAQSSGQPIELSVHFGTFSEFDKRIRKVIVSPDGMIEFLMKDGTSLGRFTIDELTAEYTSE